MSPAKPDNATKDLAEVLEKIAGMPAPYRKIAERLHKTIVDAGPNLKPRLWYGMPGYATGRSKPVLVFFRLDGETMTLGLSEKATVDQEPDSTLHPCAWYLEELDEPTVQKVAGLVRTAFG